MTSWVLIVDDEEMIRENLKAYLEDEGLQVMAFESVTPALNWLGEVEKATAKANDAEPER